MTSDKPEFGTGPHQLRPKSKDIYITMHMHVQELDLLRTTSSLNPAVLMYVHVYRGLHDFAPYGPSPTHTCTLYVQLDLLCAARPPTCS